MNISKTNKNGVLTVALDGRLDANSAPELEAEMDTTLEGINLLVLDFEKVSYISSAGLRVVLKLQKRMNKQGVMKLVKVNEAVMEVFDITGFLDILTVEE